MSPEYRIKQLFNEDFNYDLSFNSDIYSLGILILKSFC